MGIIKQGVLGPFKNKVGSVVGRAHRKQNIMTGLYNISEIAPTEKQIEWRDKFGMLSSFLSEIEPLVTPGFKKYAKNKSAVSVANSFNSKHAYRQEGDEWVLNYPRLMYARGDISIPESPQLAVSGFNIVFSWLQQAQNAECQYTDMGSILIYNATKNRAIIKSNIVSRYALQYSAEIPEQFVGDTLHCYMSFASADGKKSGNSMYLGELVITSGQSQYLP